MGPSHTKSEDASSKPTYPERLRSIFAESDRGSTTKIQAALRLGAEYFEVEHGHLVHVDPADGTHEIMEVSGPHPTIASGQKVDLSDTYCRLVIANGDTLLVDNTGRGEWSKDPARDLFELGCYLGAKVVVGTQFYGTLCFVDREPTGDPFDAEDRDFLELIAQEIGQELARRGPSFPPKRGGGPTESDELLGRVKDATDTGGWEYDPAADSVRGTRQLCRLLGVSPEAEHGAQEALRFFSAPVRQKVRQAARSCLREGKSFEIEVPLQVDDGDARWARIRGDQLQGDDEQGVRLVGTLEDITARKQAERALQDEQQMLRRMYRIAAHRGFSFKEKVDAMLEIGREFLGLPYGFLTRVEEGEQRIEQASGTHSLLQAGTSCPLSEAYCRKTIDADELLAVHNAREAGWAEDPAYERFELGTYIGSQVMVEGELYGTFCFASSVPRDEPFRKQERMLVELITLWTGYELSQRRSTQRLKRQNRRLDRFASVVSHDLRNPLNVVKGRLDLVKQECTLSDDGVDHLASADRALGRMNEIISDVLTLTRGEEKVKQGDFVSLRLEEVAQACWATVDTEQATLHVSSDRRVEADKGRLRQLLENLFRNAVEHGGSDVAVRVGSLDDGFFVEDDGEGIPAEDRERVLEEGYSSSTDGTGLGLSIVNTVAEAHGWSVAIGEGREGGARFEVTGKAFAAPTADVAEQEVRHESE